MVPLEFDMTRVNCDNPVFFNKKLHVNCRAFVLIWHGRILNDRLFKLHEIFVYIIYNEKDLSFQCLVD